MKKLILIMAFAIAMVSCTISSEDVTGTGGAGTFITQAELEEAFKSVTFKGFHTLLVVTLTPSGTANAGAGSYNGNDGFGPDDSIGEFERKLEIAIDDMIVAPTARNISRDFVSLDRVYIENRNGGIYPLDYFSNGENLNITVKFNLEKGVSTIDGKDTMSLVYKMDVGA